MPARLWSLPNLAPGSRRMSYGEVIPPEVAADVQYDLWGECLRARVSKGQSGEAQRA